MQYEPLIVFVVHAILIERARKQEQRGNEHGPSEQSLIPHMLLATNQ
jgi:hypothetical protein